MRSIFCILSLFFILSDACNADAFFAEAITDTVVCKTKCDFAHSIDLLGFEKRLNDKRELFIIRNNTEETITLIKLRVYYKTDTGEMLNYRDVVLVGELLPHTTKHFDSPSFDTDKRYFFINNPPSNKKVEGYPFDITFDLLRYDISVTH